MSYISVAFELTRASWNISPAGRCSQVWLGGRVQYTNSQNPVHLSSEEKYIFNFLTAETHPAEFVRPAVAFVGTGMSRETLFYQIFTVV